MQRPWTHRKALGLELPQAGVTGLGGPAGGRGINATTAGPLPGGGGGGGGALAPTPVASQDVIEWPALVEAWQILGETDPTECPAACLVSTWRPATRRTYTSHLRRFAQFGGTVQPKHMQALAEKVLLSMFAQGQKAAAARGCISALKAVATLGWIPPLAMGQAVENFQGGSGFPGTTTVWRARLAPAHG